MNTRRLMAVLPLLLLGPVACGTDVLPAAAVADGAEQALEQQIGVRPDVTCPRDVEQTVGATAHCTVQVDGTQFAVTVRLTEVDGKNVAYAVDVADHAAS